MFQIVHSGGQQRLRLLQLAVDFTQLCDDCIVRRRCLNIPGDKGMDAAGAVVYPCALEVELVVRHAGLPLLMQVANDAGIAVDPAVFQVKVVVIARLSSVCKDVGKGLEHLI